MRKSEVLNHDKILNMRKLVKPIVSATKNAKYEPYYFNEIFKPFEEIDVKKTSNTSEKSNSDKLSVNEDLNQKESKFDHNSIDKWYKFILSGEAPQTRSSHCSFIYNEEHYVLLGYNFKEKISSEMYKVRIKENYNRWMKVDNIKGDIPMIESGARSVLVQNKLYVFGGYISSLKCNSLMYELNLDTLTWSILGNFSNVTVNQNSNNNSNQNNDLYYTSNLYSLVKENSKDPYYQRKKQIEQYIDHYPHLQISGHVMVYSSFLKGLIVHGGLINNRQINKSTYLFNLETKSWETLIDGNDESELKFKVSTSKNSKQDQIDLSTQQSNVKDTYILELNEENWLYNHAGCIVNDNKFYIFGGVNINHKQTNSVYVLDISELNNNSKSIKGWQLVQGITNTDFFEYRCNHTATYFEGNVYIFGGKTRNMQELNSFIRFNPDTLMVYMIHPTLLEVNPQELDLNICKSKYFFYKF
jgi:hypothetical protein